MTQKNQHHKSGKPDEDLETFFEKAHDAYDEQAPDIDASEIETAFRNVVKKTTAKKNAYDRRFIWKYAAVAAVLLIVAIGILYMSAGYVVRAPVGKIRTVQLSDGTVITLKGGSKLMYRRWFGMWGRTVSLNGEAFFNVTHTGAPFRVKAGRGRITVMGTKFDVRVEHLKTSVFLKKGRVKFSAMNDKEHAVILSPGEYSWISAKQATPVQPRKIKSSKVTGWLQQGLSFTDQPLSVIFDKISSRYHVKIKTESDSLKKEKLTIYFSKIKNVEQMISDICRAKGLQYIKKDDTFIISRTY